METRSGLFAVLSSWGYLFGGLHNNKVCRVLVCCVGDSPGIIILGFPKFRFPFFGVQRISKKHTVRDIEGITAAL